MKVLHLQENKLGKDYATGDVHGAFDKLREELKEVNFDETKDRLFFVGDLVDRGPLSEESIDWLAKPWVFSCRGNHEQMAIDHVNGLSIDEMYARNGGQWFLNLPESHQRLFAEIFNDLPLAIDIQVGDKLYGIIHAEVPGEDWAKIEEGFNGDRSASFEMVAMWSRDKINYGDPSFIKNVELVYVGHTPMKEVTVLGNVIYIDTGACRHNGKVTLLEIY